MTHKHLLWGGALITAACGGEPRDIGVVRSDDSALVVCPAGATVEGIDVSQWQGSINWPQVKAAGKVFAITRVGDGYYEDPTFQTNWDAIKAQGMVRGVYQFFRPGKDPDMQADILIRRVGRLGAGDLPAVIDVEETDGQPASVTAQKVKRWADRVAAGTGKAPMVYTGKYFWNDNVKSNELAQNPLWIAAWGPPCPDTPSAWGGWRMWQYSSSGTVAGISGRVDLDKFNGSEADLRAFAGGPDWAAKYVKQSWPLATMALEMKAGSRVEAYIELRNAGLATWDGRTRLGTSAPRDRQSPFFDAATWLAPHRAAAVKGAVPPGGTFRFPFAFQAPMAPGDYHEHFNLLTEGVAWFSDPGQGGPPDGQIEAWIRVVPGDPQPPPDLGGADPDGGGAVPDGGDGTDGDTVDPVPQPGGCACQLGGRGGHGAQGAGALGLLLLLLLPLRRQLQLRQRPHRRR